MSMWNSGTSYPPEIYRTRVGEQLVFDHGYSEARAQKALKKWAKFIRLSRAASKSPGLTAADIAKWHKG